MLLGLLTALILASETPPPADAPPASPPHTFLKGAEARQPCGVAGGNGEIVVCARKEAEEQFRLRPLPGDATYAAKPVRAEARVLGNGTLSAHTDSADVGGFASKRAMVTLTLPF